MPKLNNSNATFCSQTVLPDRSILTRQKCVENAKIEKFKCDIFDDFQTVCTSLDQNIDFWRENSNETI